MADISLRDLLIKVGFDVKDAGLIKVNKEVGSLIGSTVKLGAVIASLGAVFFGLAYSTARNAVEIAKYSKILGTTTDELQRLRNAAQLSEVDFDSLMIGLRMFNRTIGEAQQGHKEFSKRLAEGGITSLKVNGIWKTQTQLLEDVSDKLANTANASKRVAIAVELFGRSGTQLLPFLTKGKKGIEELMQATDQYGYMLTEQDIKASESFEKQRKTFGIFVVGVKNYLGAQLIPTFNKYLKLILDTIKAHKTLILLDIKRFFSLIELALLPLNIALRIFYSLFNTIANAVGGWNNLLNSLGIAIAIVFGYKSIELMTKFASVIFTRLVPAFLSLDASALPMELLPMLLLAIGAALYLLYDDYKHFEAGQDSLIGRIVTKYPVAAKVLMAFGETIKFVGKIIKVTILDIVDIFKLFFDSISVISGALSKIPFVGKFFGKVTGGMDFNKMLDKYTASLHEINKNSAQSLRLSNLGASSALAQAGGGGKNITIHSTPTVNINVPAGTASSQQDWFKSQIQSHLDEQLQKHLKEVIINNPDIAGS